VLETAAVVDQAHEQRREIAERPRLLREAVDDALEQVDGPQGDRERLGEHAENGVALLDRERLGDASRHHPGG
jgi:hypothetical protein